MIRLAPGDVITHDHARKLWTHAHSVELIPAGTPLLVLDLEDEQPPPLIMAHVLWGSRRIRTMVNTAHGSFLRPGAP